MIAAIVRALVDAGASGDAIVAAVEAAERIAFTKEEARLEAQRERSRNYRARRKALEEEERHITSRHVTERDETSPQRKVSPHPSKETIPPTSLRSVGAATIDPRAQLFGIGLQTLASLSGRPEGKLRSVLGRWLRDADDDALRVLNLITKAARDQPAEPIAWIERHLHPSGQAPPRSMSAKLSALTDQPIEKTLNDYLAKHEDRADRGEAGRDQDCAAPALRAISGTGW